MTITKEEFVKEAIEKDVNLKRKLFSDELDRYMRSYKDLNAKYKSFIDLISEMHNFPSSEVPQAVNKLMPVVLANLSQKHEVIVTLDKTNSWSSRVLVATPQGIRARSENGFHTAELSAKNIREMFGSKSAEIEAWIKTNKPKKLQDWIDFKTAFMKGFNDKYCDDGARDYSYNSKEDDSSTIQIDKKLARKELSWINEASRSYDIERVSFGVDELSIRYNIPRNHGAIYFVDVNICDKTNKGKLVVQSDKGYLQFDEDNAFKMMELRELMPNIMLLLDEAKNKITEDNKVQRAWWADFNKSMGKYISMMNL
jgi:hypothetical protein